MNKQAPILPWPFAREPARAAYRSLIELAGVRCATCGLILRQWALPPRGGAVLSALAPFLLADEPVSAWPGTEMTMGYTCRQLRYRVSAELLKILSESVDGLYGWLRELPEDLHFLRADGSVWLQSTAHERLGLLWLTHAERSALAISARELDRVLAREPVQE